jgi:hypothetical protein
LDIDDRIVNEGDFVSIARKLMPNASFTRTETEQMKTGVGVKRRLAMKTSTIPLFKLVLAFEHCGYAVLAQDTLASCVG